MLELRFQRLTDQDMEIVVYYASQNNKVSAIVFYVTMRGWKKIFVLVSFSK
jgi:hypothetical protein